MESQKESESGTVRVGYAVGTGDEVRVPVGHLVVTGQTQASGKTTLLEGLASRAGTPAIVFVTKRGEGSFTMERSRAEGGRIPPYFKSRTGWQFVSEILGAVLNEGLKSERFWIMKVSRGARGLEEVYRNTEVALKVARRAGDVQVLTTMVEYFNLFMPELRRLGHTDELKTGPGLNVMDLSGYSAPLQMLVIGSVVEEVYRKHRGVIVVIPEAWEFAPEGRTSPAKRPIETLIRKGGNLQNFVWLDSQDLGGVDKRIVRQCPVWCFGVQREHNEIARTLKQVPGTVRKPKAEDVMTLGLGEFLVCYGSTVVKTYVQPAWMTGELAQVVARGGTVALPRAPIGVPAYVERVDPPFRGMPLIVDESVYPKDSLIALDLSRLRGTDFQASADFQKLPPGAEPASVNSEVKEDDVTAEQRWQLEEIIRNQSATIARLDEENKELHRDLQRSNEALMSRPGTPSSEPRERVKLPPPVWTIQDEIAEIVDQVFADPRMRSAGVVTVEPREVVLADYLAAEAERVLALLETFTEWQKDVVRFLEASGKPYQKAAIVTALTGRRTLNMPRDFKAEYEEIDNLAALGFVRKDPKNGIYPNLVDGIRRRCAVFEPSDSQIQDVIGQVMLRLKS